MKTCRMTRLDVLGALGKAALFDVGTLRQPSRICPSLATARSISCSHAIRDAGSFGRNTMPTPYWPIGRQREALRAARLAQEAVGQLDQDARAVALQRIRARRAAVGQVPEDRQAPAL